MAGLDVVVVAVDFGASLSGSSRYAVQECFGKLFVVSGAGVVVVAAAPDGILASAPRIDIVADLDVEVASAVIVATAVAAHDDDAGLAMVDCYNKNSQRIVMIVVQGLRDSIEFGYSSGKEARVQRIVGLLLLFVQQAHESG